MDREQKIKSKIRPELFNATLKKGAVLAGLGAILMLLAGTLLPIDLLKLFGIPLFIISLLLIGFGLLPYKKLARLQLKPNELSYDGNAYLFSKAGKPLFIIPEKSVEKMRFLEKLPLYGLALWLKRPHEEKIEVLDSYFNMEAFMTDSARRFEGCDLFLPYFLEADIKSLLESDHAS